MADDQPTRKDSESPRSLWQAAKHAAIGGLFFVILLIPRLRRLRRRVRVWTLIRIIAGLAGLGLGWRAYHSGSGWLIGGATTLVLFALLVRAKPAERSLDETARELGALTVLNGGTFVLMTGQPRPGVHIFAGLERLVVLDGRKRRLCEIPMAKLRRCIAQPVAPFGDAIAEGKPWELVVAWESESPLEARFRFQGFFAEHLARVAERSLRNLLTRELPVLKV